MIGNEIYFFMAIHQESIVTPENIDAIRALYGKSEKLRIDCNHKQDSWNPYVGLVNFSNDLIAEIAHVCANCPN